MDHRNGTDKWEDYEDHHDTLRDHLVSVTRDSAIRTIESNPSRLPEIIALCKKQRWVFFRRLALTLLQRFYAAAPDLAVAWTLDRSCLNLTGPEYARLLRTCFKTLSKGHQETVLSWIDDGPELPNLPEAYTDTMENAPARRHCRVPARRPAEEVRSTQGEIWRCARRGRRAPSDQLVVRPTSPFRDEELAQMTPTQVVDTIASWKPSSEFGSPEPEELSHTLERVVGQKPESYAAAAGDLKRLQPIYIPGALRGFAVAVRAGHAFDWRPVVDLCAWVTSHPRKVSAEQDLLSMTMPTGETPGSRSFGCCRTA